MSDTNCRAVPTRTTVLNNTVHHHNPQWGSPRAQISRTRSLKRPTDVRCLAPRQAEFPAGSWQSRLWRSRHQRHQGTMLSWKSWQIIAATSAEERHHSWEDSRRRCLEGYWKSMNSHGQYKTNKCDLSSLKEWWPSLKCEHIFIRGNIVLHLETTFMGGRVDTGMRNVASQHQGKEPRNHWKEKSNDERLTRLKIRTIRWKWKDMKEDLFWWSIEKLHARMVPVEKSVLKAKHQADTRTWFFRSSPPFGRPFYFTKSGPVGERLFPNIETLWKPSQKGDFFRILSTNECILWVIYRCQARKHCHASDQCAFHSMANWQEWDAGNGVHLKSRRIESYSDMYSQVHDSIIGEMFRMTRQIQSLSFESHWPIKFHGISDWSDHHVSQIMNHLNPCYLS
jgi:hypothetical protein